MKSIRLHRPGRSLVAALLIPLLAFLLACGPGEEPTPTAVPTATPTQAVGTTPTITSPGPTAVPTPTTQATPVPTPSEKPKYGGRILHLNSNYPPDYDAHNLYTAGYEPVHSSLYSTVFRNVPGPKGTEGVLYCEICTDWYLEDGGKTMVFNMIQGIKFHDGKEMTSADVAYSLKKIMGQIDGIISLRSGSISQYITSIETPSRYQLKVHMSRPSVYVPKVLNFEHSAIYPEGTTRAMLKEKPYGSGPFVLKKAISGASMAFDRNPNYFKPDIPYVDGVDQVIVGDAATQEAAFLTKKMLVSLIFSPQYMDMLEGLVAKGEMSKYIGLGGCGMEFVGWVYSKPPFNDIRLRKAVNLALDRKVLGDIGWGKYAVIHLLYFSEGMEFARPEEKIWNVAPGFGTGAKKQQEIQDAKKLLIDAGYPKGMDLEAISHLITASGQGSIVEPVYQMLKEIGIRTTLTQQGTTENMIRFAALDYQIAKYSGCVLSQDPDEIIAGYWITGASRPWFDYRNPEVDRLYPLMSGELDPQKRRDLYWQIQDIIVTQDVAWAPLPRNENFTWWWKSLKNYFPGTTGKGYTGNKYEYVWIDK